jgi:hypothetical protein
MPAHHGCALVVKFRSREVRGQDSFLEVNDLMLIIVIVVIVVVIVIDVLIVLGLLLSLLVLDVLVRVLGQGVVSPAFFGSQLPSGGDGHEPVVTVKRISEGVL